MVFVSGQKVRLTHGGTGTRLYRIYSNIKSRCLNPNVSRYSDYGGRGIGICQEWSEQYEAFRDWAMSNGYADNLCIDRIDNDKHYEPSNCRWVTVEQNNTNQRSNVFVTIDHETKTVSQWGADSRFAAKASTIRRRIKLGWSPEMVVTTPLQPPMLRKKRQHNTLI